MANSVFPAGPRSCSKCTRSYYRVAEGKGMRHCRLFNEDCYTKSAADHGGDQEIQMRKKAKTCTWYVEK